MKKLIATLILLTNVSLASSELNDKQFVLAKNYCISGFYEESSLDIPIKNVEAYCECGVKKIAKLPPEKRNIEKEAFKAAKPCLYLIFE